jgi:tRNA-intron endonuclease
MIKCGLLLFLCVMSPQGKGLSSANESEPKDKVKPEKFGLGDTTDHQEAKSNNDAESESNFLVEASFQSQKGKIIVYEQRHQDQLRNKGFGDIFNKEFLLDELEALYLLQNKKLVINYNKNKSDFSFSDFLKILIKRDKKLLTKFLVYRDLRSKGYVVKNGFGFGTDFRVYERGDYGKKPSKYVAIGINEGTNIKASVFVGTLEQVEAMGKNAVIAVVERRGEVIYYKISRVSFFENKGSK